MPGRRAPGQRGSIPKAFAFAESRGHKCIVIEIPGCTSVCQALGKYMVSSGPIKS
jgi:hypothetical protein